MLNGARFQVRGAWGAERHYETVFEASLGRRNTIYQVKLRYLLYHHIHFAGYLKHHRCSIEDRLCSDSVSVSVSAYTIIKYPIRAT